MKITALALRHKVAVTVLSVTTLILGWYGLTTLDVNYLPSITYPLVRIQIWWRGATPEEVETNLADPIERTMATIDNLDYLDSSSIEGMYTLLVNFRHGTDVDAAYQDVMAVMGRVNPHLPTDIEPPMIFKADPSQLPVMELTVASEQRSLVWLRDWADNWLVERLSAIPGTAGAEVVGGLKREIRVHLDPGRLNAYGVSADRVAAAISEANRQLFAGRVTVATREIIARTMGEFESLDEIRDTAILRGDDGAIVRVRDVATVEDSHEEQRINTRFNGQPSVKINVLRQAEANTVEVAKAVAARLEELQLEVPSDIKFGIVENQANYVMGAISGVRDSAIMAAILVILVTYLFLGHWRQVVVMLVALPVTFLASFFLMKLAGFSLNLFSLGGLVVALGMILDNSTVVIENITRLRQEQSADDPTAPHELTLRATGEVAPALVAGTVTFLVIFLPFLFIPGMASLLFRELVLVIAGMVLLSLLTATTLTPYLTNLLVVRSGRSESGWLGRTFDLLVNRLTVAYATGLSLLLRLRWLTLALFILLLAGGIYLMPRTGSEFLPKVDDGRVMVKLKLPAGTAVGETDRILAQIEQEIGHHDEIENIFVMAGGHVMGIATYEIASEGEVDIYLKPRSQRKVTTQGFVDRIAPLARRAIVPGAKMPVMPMPMKGIRRIGQQDIEVLVQGAEIAPIFDFAATVAAHLETMPEVTGVNISMEMTQPEYRVHIDRARASSLGITTAAIANRLRGMVGGTVTTDYRDGNDYYNIRVMVPEPEINNRTDLENLMIESRNGRPIYLRDVATVRQSVGPVEITREDQVKQVIVRADATGRSVGAATKLVADAVADLERPAGVSFAMGAQAEMMAENARSMGAILAFAFFFAFVVLALQFDSYRLPLIMLLSIPFCLSGMIFALNLTGLPIGATVAIGIFIVMAAAINDGVLLLTFAEELRLNEGYSPRRAVLDAARIRLRPRVMTTISTIAGFVPLALNIGEGGDMLQPMAVAAIGGLLLEIAVALYLMPLLYLFFTNPAKGKNHEDHQCPHRSHHAQPA